jgi:hypothetical protein
MKKTIVITAGLGPFYGASKRIKSLLKDIQTTISFELIDVIKLREIASQYGIPDDVFSPVIRGYGFWQWKPLLIHHYLREGYKNIIYLDAGNDIEPISFKKYVEWFEVQNDFKLILSRTGHNSSTYTKPSVIKRIHKDPEIDLDKVEMLQASLIFLKADSNIKSIFESAVKYIQNKNYDLFDDGINNYSEIPSNFIDHRHDQAVLSLLILNSGYMNEVGVLPTTLTPPSHRDWALFPPVIASRNSLSVSLYWPYIKYNNLSAFPTVLVLQLRLMNKLSQLLNYPCFLLRFFNSFLEKIYRRNSKDEVFKSSGILRLPVYTY